MKYIIYLLFFAFIINAQDLELIDAKDHTVMLSADPSSNPIQIKLIFPQNANVKQYLIKRRSAWSNSNFPSNYLAQIPGSSTEYIDTDVQVGELYEYEVTAVAIAGVKGKDSEGNNITTPIDMYAFGYCTAGIEVPEPDDYGAIMLIIDETMKESLAAEVERLRTDLTLEGYTVLTQYVARAESFDKDKVSEVKKIIKDTYSLFGDDFQTVFLLGRVPVPYSGLTAPDGHIPNHLGAWPSDIYYAELNDLYFTDNQVDNSGADREATKNVPGDGKFDVTVLPTTAKIDLMLGRVDLYNMPAFEKSEVELLKSYLDQNHKYRNNNLDFEARGLIEDTGFPAYNMLEGFASSGWRNFGVFFGAKNVSKQDFLETLKDNSYQWVYGTGPGSYKSAGNIATTADYAANEVKGLFSMLFGSYFGDWDVADNLLRAPLCSDYPSLSNAWVGRPQWFMHHLAAGYSLGYATRLSQNNNPGNGYIPNILVLPPQYPNGVVYSTGYREIHIALMGDPTLRLEMGIIRPPVNVVGTVVKNGAELTWESPLTAVPVKFNIYRRTEDDPIFRKINDEMLVTTEFTDKEGFEGTTEYLIKSAQLHYTNTASMYKESRGVLVELLNTSVEERQISDNIAIFPNPATESTEIKISTHNEGIVSIEIFDIRGNEVYNFGDRMMSQGVHSFKWDLRSSEGTPVESGVYILKLKIGGTAITEKISVIK